MTDQHDARDAVSWQVRRTDGSPLAVWETCTKELYELTLMSGRYCGFENAPPCEVRALGVLAATQPTKPEQQAGGVPAGLKSRPMHELSPDEQERAVHAFEASHIDSFEYGDVLHRVWIEGFDFACRAAAPSQSAVGKPLSRAGKAVRGVFAHPLPTPEKDHRKTCKTVK